MVMQMVKKLWHILPTSCACKLGEKSGVKRCGEKGVGLHKALPWVYTSS